MTHLFGDEEFVWVGNTIPYLEGASDAGSHDSHREEWKEVSKERIDRQGMADGGRGSDRSLDERAIQSVSERSTAERAGGEGQTIEAAEGDCAWITVHGQHICIKEGQNKSDAIKEHFAKLAAPSFKQAMTHYKDKDWTKSKLAIAQQKQLEKYALGKTKRLLGVYKYGSTPAKIYQSMMTGEWHKLDDISKMYGADEKHIDWLGKVKRFGLRTDQWHFEFSGNSVRMVMHQVQDQAKGQTGITDDLHQAALKVVQKLIGNKGLDTTISKSAMDEYLHSVGLKNVDLLASSVSSWTGDPDGDKAQYLKRVAADYYGNDWSKEWKDHASDYGKDTSAFKYDELKKQAMAIKALSNAYMQASGMQYLYRGMSLKPEMLKQISESIKGGKPIGIPLNSLSGFSKKLSTADDFGGDVVVRVKVNPEEVWVASGALPHMFGTFAHGEQEYIVGSKSNTVAYFDPEDVYLKKSSATGYHSHKPDWAEDLYASAMLTNKLTKILYNILGGGPGSGRHPYGKKAKPLSDKATAAKASYVPQTKGKSKIARLNEEVVARLTGSKTTGDNKPFDCIKGKKFGIEVKTIFPTAKNDKITMHKESLKRKVKAMKELGLKKVYTVAIDMRDMKNLQVYVRKGLGSFRLSGMNKIGAFRHLTENIK